MKATSLLAQFPFFTEPDKSYSRSIQNSSRPTTKEFPLGRVVNAYAQYTIPTKIQPSIFPYFLHSPTKKPSSHPKSPKEISTSKKKKKFILKLPNKAFKIKNITLKQTKSSASSVLEQVNHLLQERRFSAVKKTVPLERFRKQEEANEAITRVFKHDESHKKDSFLHSPMASFSPLSSSKRPRAATSRSKRDLLDIKALNNSQLSMKSSLMNMDYFLPGRKPQTKDKDKAFFDIYLNSFDESPNNKMKMSRISRISSPLVLAPSFLHNRENLSNEKKEKANALKLNKVEYSLKEEKEHDDSPIKEKENKKRTDHNFMKILLHYWKYEKIVSKNRPPLPKKMIIWNRKINFTQVRKSLLELLMFLAKSTITLAEVKSFLGDRL